MRCNSCWRASYKISRDNRKSAKCNNNSLRTCFPRNTCCWSKSRTGHVENPNSESWIERWCQEMRKNSVRFFAFWLLHQLHCEKVYQGNRKNRFMLSFGTYFVDDNWENNWFVKKTQLSCGSSRRYWHHSCTLQCMLLWWKSRWRSFRPWNIYSSRLRPVKSSYKCN